MRTYFYTFLLMLVTCFMSLTTLHAQIEDHDPGIFYIIQDQTGPFAIEEGLGWTITFSCTDSLGTEYNHPVQMHFEGGGYHESSNFSMQNIDSMVMYQPEPEMVEGVYEITREHFPYILGVDTTYTIIYVTNQYSDYFDLPEVGTKVVCNYEEQPLPLGFVGIVEKVEYLTDSVAIICNENYESLTEFYKKALIVKRLVPTKQALNKAPGRKLSRRQTAIRNSQNSKSLRKGEEAPDFVNMTWQNWLTVPLAPDTYKYSDGDLSVSVSLLGPTFKGGFNLDLAVYIDGEWKASGDISEWIASEKWSLSAVWGVQGGIGVHVEGQWRKEALIKGLMDEPLKFWKYELKAQCGLYFVADTKLTLDIPVLSFEQVQGYRFGEGGGFLYEEKSNKDPLQLSNVSFTVDGYVAPIALIMAFSMDDKDKQNDSNSQSNDESAKTTGHDFEIKLEVDAIKLRAYLKWTNNTYSKDTPEQLFSVWQTEADNFKLTFKALNVHFSFNCAPTFKLFEKVKGIGPTLGYDKDLYALYEHDFQYLPDWYSELLDKKSDGNFVSYKNKTTLSNHLFPWYSQTWIYDLEQRQFIQKLPTCSSKFWSEITGITEPFDLRKGKVYQIVNAFARKESDDADWMTNIVPAKFRAPYDLETKASDGSLFKAVLDQVALSDNAERMISIIDVGFQVVSFANKKNIDHANKQSCYNTWDKTCQSFELEPRNLTEGNKYSYRPYIVIEDNFDRSVQYGDIKDFTCLVPEIEDPYIMITGINVDSKSAIIATTTGGFRNREYTILYRYTDNIDLPKSQWKTQRSQLYGPSSSWEMHQNEVLTNLESGTEYYVEVEMEPRGTIWTLEPEGAFFTTDGPIVTPGEWVDLGLTSGALWASCNLGASEPQEYGEYYAWGEIAPKYEYTEANYPSDNDGNPVDIWTDDLNDEHDPIVIETGGEARMPYIGEIAELFDECDREMITYEGIKGLLFKSTKPGNNNAIFIPANGVIDDQTKSDAGKCIYLWTRSFCQEIDGLVEAYAVFKNISKGNDYLDNCCAYLGMGIRAVKPGHEQ